MSDQTTPEVTAETIEQQNPPAGGVQLQLSDLFVSVQAIAIASTRGAFRPEEFTQIGSAYDRIVAFLKANGAIAPASTEQEQPKNEKE